MENFYLLHFHMVNDASNISQGKATVFPYLSTDNTTYWFDLSGTKEMFRSLYGYSLNDNDIQSYLQVRNNRIGVHAGDSGSWTYLTLKSTEVSGDQIIMIYDYEDMSFADDQVVAAGQIAASYDVNSSTSIGYTFNSVWIYGLNPVL